MSVHYAIDTCANVVHLRLDGVLDERAMLAMFDPYLGNHRVAQGRSCLVDLSEVKRFDIDFAGLVALVERMRPHFADQADQNDVDLCHALFAPSDIAFGTGRMYQSIGQDRLPARIGVFRTLCAARQFLGITHTTA